MHLSTELGCKSLCGNTEFSQLISKAPVQNLTAKRKENRNNFTSNRYQSWNNRIDLRQSLGNSYKHMECKPLEQPLDQANKLVLASAFELHYLLIRRSIIQSPIRF